jgi:protein-disulfide isomerase
MSELETGAGRGSLFRAGRALAGALFTQSGARWARPRLRIGRGAMVGLLVAGGAAAGYAANQSAVPDKDRTAIETVVRDYLLENPEVIRDAMVVLEKRRVVSLIDENRQALETPFAGAWEGAEKPQVTLVAFMDYACGYCRTTVPTFTRLIKEDPGLRIVYHELPVISEASVPAARVSLYAAEMGRFPAYHHALYAAGKVDNDSILAAAKTAGLDSAKVKAEMEGTARMTQLSQSVRLAQSLEAQGTPLLVVGDRIFYGAVGYEALKEAIAEARKPG